MKVTRADLEQKAAGWLQQGISPRRLALTLALGFAIGCVPMVGVTTFLCAGLAVVLGLNLPAIQVANYAALPFQLALIAPFLKLGAKVLAFASRPDLGTGMLTSSPMLTTAAHAGGMAGQAMLGWLIVATPTVMLMTLGLTLALNRLPALNSSQS